MITEKWARKPLGFSRGMNGPLGLRSVLFCGTIQHEQHSIHLVMYHIIWCPKRQRKVLVGSVHGRLKQIIREVADEHDREIIRLAIQPDHVHLFIRSDPYTLPSDIPRLIKGRSAHDLREALPHLKKLPSLWTRSFFLSTAGNVSQEIIPRHIERRSKT